MKPQHGRTRHSPVAACARRVAVASALASGACSSAVSDATRVTMDDGETDGAHSDTDTSPTNIEAGVPPGQSAEDENEAGARPSIDGKEWAELLDQGAWLVSWAAAALHYTWFRFAPEAPGASQGTFEIREIDDCSGRCMRYVDCTGAGGRYSVNGSELLISYPPLCETRRSTLVIRREGAAALFAREALAVWPVTPDEGRAIEAYYYPPSQCDPEFSSYEVP